MTFLPFKAAYLSLKTVFLFRQYKWQNISKWSAETLSNGTVFWVLLAPETDACHSLETEAKIV